MTIFPSSQRSTSHFLKVIIPQLFLFLSLIMSSNLYAGSVSLSWDANSESDLAGYNIYKRILPSPEYGSPISSELPPIPSSPKKIIN